MNLKGVRLGDISYRDTYSGIGRDTLLAGDEQCGFFGEVTVEELFGAGNNASLLVTDTLGITQGTAQNLTENWLKFAWKGKILFYPKKSIRHSISWDEIYRKGCVYGTGVTISTAEQTMLDNALASDGVTIYKNWLFSVDGIYRTPQTAEITLNGKDYVVRLMKGTQDDPAPGNYGRPGVGNDNEWNRLILPLYEQTYDKDWHRVVDGSANYSAYVNSVTPDWKTYYSDDDLGTHYSYGNGSYAWVQEFTEAYDPRMRVIRGEGGATFLYAYYSWLTYTYYGLRLVLEEK